MKTTIAIIATMCCLGTSQVADEQYWVSFPDGTTHNSSCRLFEYGEGHHSHTGSGKNCQVCGGTEE